MQADHVCITLPRLTASQKQEKGKTPAHRINNTTTNAKTNKKNSHATHARGGGGAVLSQMTRRKLATTSSDKTAKIWDVTKDFELKATLEGHSAWVWDCAFSADSSLLVTGACA